MHGHPGRGGALWSMGGRLLSMCFDQVAPHDTVVNFKPVHFGNRSGVGSNMTDISPEHVGIVARTAWLQRFGRESDRPSVFGVNWLMGRHESRQDCLVRIRFLNSVVHLKRNRRLDIKQNLEPLQLVGHEMWSDTEDGAFSRCLNGVERLSQGTLKPACQVLSDAGSHQVFLSFGRAASRWIFKEELKRAAATHIERQLFQVSIRKIRCVDDAYDARPARSRSESVA